MKPNPAVAAALAEYADLLAVAATWTPDPVQQRAMVEAYFRGRAQREQLERERTRIEQ